MRILQEGVAVDSNDVISMVDDGVRSLNVSPDLRIAAETAATDYVLDNVPIIDANIHRAFQKNSGPRTIDAITDIKTALKSLRPGDRSEYLAAFLRLSTPSEVMVQQHGAEARRLPFSFDQLPGLIDFYQSKKDFFDLRVESILKSTRHSESVDVSELEESAVQAVKAVGIEGNIVVTTRRALGTTSLFSEYSQLNSVGSAQYLLQHVRDGLRYQKYVEQLSNAPSPLNASEIEVVEESAA